MWIRSSKTLANPSVIGLAILLAAGSVALGCGESDEEEEPPAQGLSDPHAQPAVAPDDIEQAADNPAYTGFLKRTNDYVALRRTLEGGLPPLKPTDQPTRTQLHSRELAERIREARAAAQAGDVFGDAGDAIRNAVKVDAENRDVRDVYAAMQEVPVKAPPAINAAYPEKAALATVPPLLLLRLPRLPDALEYRFMGRDLILHDSIANIVVDILREAAPIVQRAATAEKATGPERRN